VFDICWSVGGRLFQAAGASYENARWPNFIRVRGCSYRSLLPDRSIEVENRRVRYCSP